MNALTTLTALTALTLGASTLLGAQDPELHPRLAEALALIGADDEFPKLSPFTAVRVNGEGYEVELDGEWFRLVTLAGFSAGDLRAYCDQRYGSKSEKRFAEDLIEVLAGLGRVGEHEVDLVLERLASGERVERAGVPMTREKRQRVWAARRAADDATFAWRVTARVERPHARVAAPEFAHLARPLAGWANAPTLARQAAERDLDQLEWLLEHTYSYRDLRGVDYRAALDAVRAGLDERVPLGAFATRVAELLALFGDGHTLVRGVESLHPAGYLPFLVADAEGGVVAFRDDRTGLVDPQHPFLVAIDGRPVAEWLALAARTQAAGSPQFVRFHALRDLRLLGALRVEAGAEPTAEVEVVLADLDGEQRSTRLPVADRKPVYGAWPRTDRQRLLEGNVGYLRVASMDDEREFLDGLVAAMEAFRETRGLVIDVRGNGGGSRDALRTLLPYFLAPEGGPRVVNVGAYRLPPGDERGRPEGYLEDRFMYPASSRLWNDAERQAVEATAARFAPDWTLGASAERFSDWHYLVLSPGGAYHYERPVVVLLDTGCFSATDIFLGAFADLPTVTLMGTPSGGGSGRSQSSTLVESGLALRVSSMASFRADGRRYDGLGIEPDLVVVPRPGDFLLDGGDSLLEAALARLR